WRPDNLTKQVSAPVLRREGTTLSWDDDENTLCWAVFKNGKYYKCVTSPGCDISSDAQANYTVRAANEMGGLGPVSDPATTVAAFTPGTEMKIADPSWSFNPARKTLCMRVFAAKNLKATIFSLNGKTVLSKDVDIGPDAGEVAIPAGRLGKGVYIIRTEFNGSVKTGLIHVWQQRGGG
ncbi:MAG: T9SS type A sorting domain-containing protein, partial [Chitinispirillaceae bacterium]|nr:T9SS type A sorting domain-containing protein [Chitinispirillaceae bacterium]